MDAVLIVALLQFCKYILCTAATNLLSRYYATQAIYALRRPPPSRLYCSHWPPVSGRVYSAFFIKSRAGNGTRSKSSFRTLNAVRCHVLPSASFHNMPSISASGLLPPTISTITRSISPQLARQSQLGRVAMASHRAHQRILLL